MKPLKTPSDCPENLSRPSVLKSNFDKLKTPEERLDFVLENKEYFCVNFQRKHIFVLEQEAIEYVKGETLIFTDFEIKMSEREMFAFALTHFGLMDYHDITF